jgi:hypothetical protein
MPSLGDQFCNMIPSNDPMKGRPSVVHVARSLQQRRKQRQRQRQQQQEQQQQQQQQLEGARFAHATTSESAGLQSLQQQELSALTAGEIADLCFLRKSADNNMLPYEALDPFAMDAELRVPQRDHRSIENRLMALRDALVQSDRASPLSPTTKSTTGICSAVI